MDSADRLQRKNMENKQRIDELNDLCAKLKGDLASKEHNEYEQEVRIRDLRTQLKELSDIEEKLKLANRNARVLEEENNNLLMKLKAVENGGKHTSSTGVEAVKLIEENNKLLFEIQDLRASTNKSSFREQQLDQKCKALMEQHERLENQVALLKKRNGELEERLREEQHEFLMAREAWETERARYIKDYEELLASVQRFDEVNHQREGRDLKERGNEHQLQETLLKEDIAELEKKLRVSEDRLRSKEREWWQLENAMRNEINALKSNKDHGGHEIYRAFQDQLDSFKQEVTSLRGERRPSRALPNFSRGLSSLAEGDERINELENNIKLKKNTIEGLETVNRNITEKCANLSKENEDLREQIERIQDESYRSEEKSSEQKLRVKELEALLSAAQKDSSVPRIFKLDRELKDDSVSDVEKLCAADENKSLKKTLRRYEEDIAELNASREQQNAVFKARQREQQAQIEELLHQIESLRHRVSSRKSSNAEFHPESNELEPRGNEQVWRQRAKTDPGAVDKLSKDKTESVEDVMRMLEAAWAIEEDTKSQLKKASRQNLDFASLVGNGEQRSMAKDEELRKYMRYLDDLEEQRQKDLHRFQQEKDRLGEQIDSLQKDNRVKDDHNSDLQNRLTQLERHLRDLRDTQSDERQIKRHDDSKDNEVDAMRNRMKLLEDAIAQKEADINGISKSKDRRLQELNEQLAALRDANDGLWRQLVSLHEEKQESRGRPSSGRTSRTPRGSARRRSTENLLLSHPSSQVSEERRRTVVADGAHLAVTIVELSDVLRNGRPITETGYVIIKVKSVKEKYKTSVKDLASVVRFDETFVFYLAQPDQDIITLHVFYKAKSGSREYHIGDACFSMATLYRGVSRQRIAPVAQSPGSKDAQRSAQVEVMMQSDDFGRMVVPTEAEIEDEKLRFNELVKKLEITTPEKLHLADVEMAVGSAK